MLLGFNVLDNLEKISATSTNASKEYSLEKAMEKMKADWVGVEFRVIEYKETGTYIVGGTDEVQVWTQLRSLSSCLGHMLVHQ
jgi:dynein heavy chain, axonemal